MKLPPLPNPDEPKKQSIPRTLGESLWFGWVTERWLLEDAGHLPIVNIHDDTWAQERQFYVDRDGPILDSREQKLHTFISEDGETFTLPRIKVGPPPPEDQYLAFLGLLETHDYQKEYPNLVKNKKSLDYEPSTRLAKKFAYFLETFGGGYLFPNREVSVGALVWAAQDAGIIIEDRPHEDLRLSIEFGWQADVVYLLFRGAWLDLPLDAHDDQLERVPVSRSTTESHQVPKKTKKKAPRKTTPVKTAKSITITKKINDSAEDFKNIKKLIAESGESARLRNCRIRNSNPAMVERIISIVRTIPRSRKLREIGCAQWALILTAETGWQVSRNDIQAIAEKLGLREASRVMAPVSWLDPREIKKSLNELHDKA
jgi:hypothetical protein